MKFTRGLIVDGIHFKIPFVSIKRTADVEDKYAQRSEDRVLQREVAGVFYNYQMSVGSSKDFEDNNYEEFWDLMTSPVAFHEISIPDKNGNYTFKCYVSSVSDEYESISESGAEFKGFTCKMTAERPARTP